MNADTPFEKSPKGDFFYESLENGGGQQLQQRHFRSQNGSTELTEQSEYSFNGKNFPAKAFFGKCYAKNVVFVEDVYKMMNCTLSYITELFHVHENR